MNNNPEHKDFEYDPLFVGSNEKSVKELCELDAVRDGEEDPTPSLFGASAEGVSTFRGLDIDGRRLGLEWLEQEIRRIKVKNDASLGLS